MNILNINNAILLTALVFSVNAFAGSSPDNQSSNDGANVHANMHIYDNASVEYESWKTNRDNVEDPFKRVAEGYQIEKNYNKSQYTEGTYQPYVANFIATSFKQKDADILDRKAFRDETINYMYEISLDGDKVNTETYNAEYELYLEQKDSRASAYYETRQVEIASVGIDTYANNHSQNNFTGSRSHTATENLLGMISTDITTKKNLIRNAFVDNYEGVEASNNFGAEAKELASNFSDECPACDLPAPIVNPLTDPVEPVTEPPTTYRQPINKCSDVRWSETGITPYDNDPWHFYTCP